MKMNAIGLLEMKNIFKAAIDAVKPSALIWNRLKFSNNHLLIDDKQFEINDSEIKIDKNCYVVGFGKAVLGMAVELESMLKNHIQSGVLCVPDGSLSKMELSGEFLRKFSIYEGAKNNIPDSDSVRGTKEILSLISNLSESSILFVLISGGGSSLLCSPIHGISLEDKQKTIQLLAKSGATIQELNTVRKRLSEVKGGKLGLACEPTRTISLVLSDVIGDPLEIIASGPTVKNTDSDAKAWNVVNKYHIENQLPTNVSKILTPIGTSSQSLSKPGTFHHVTNVLLGNNLIALEAAERRAAERGFTTWILSSQIEGEARVLGRHFARLASIVSRMMAAECHHEFIGELAVVMEDLNVDPARSCQLERLIRNCLTGRKDLCLLAGGESTVRVEGCGIGGRNQEMALAWAIEIDKDESIPRPHHMEIHFLSGGTDGIDGPTDAAGAMAFAGLIPVANSQGLDASSFLTNNDSYQFFHDLHHGQFHLITGHTGTNVMDVHIICFRWTNGPSAPVL